MKDLLSQLSEIFKRAFQNHPIIATVFLSLIAFLLFLVTILRAGDVPIRLP